MELEHPAPDSPLERRRFLRIAGAASLAGLIARSVDAGPLTPCGPLWQAGACTLTPSGVEGPFYLPLNLLRQDITDGRPGFELELLLKIVRASDCAPLPGAIVDIWHASPIGRYSGFASQGTAGLTFMRGIQIAPTNGIVRFHSVFPGWYAGRATHIHLKVFPTPTTVLTTQLYFSQDTLTSVNAQPIYNARGPNPRRNADDFLFTPGTLVPVREIGSAGILPPFPGRRRLLAGFTIAVA